MTLTKDAKEQGIYYDVPFAEYLRWPLYNQSILKRASDSMAHVKAARGMTLIPTDNMLLGSALHTAFLEPDEFDNRVIEWTGKARRGKEWQEFQAEHDGKVILTSGYYERLEGMLESLRRHPFVQKWSKRIEAVEVSYVRNIGGLMCKGRIDALTDDPLVDLKKVVSTNKRLVTKTIMNFGYHIQGALYRRLTDREHFIVLAVEGDPPYDVVPYSLSDELLACGDAELDWIIPAILECEELGRWPGKHEFENADELEPPAWAITQPDPPSISNVNH